ncbi:protein lethal(2)essential for life-like [Belonocnema kinseyi]|uniref:protein lethal(2)essential for life-like n=1 Tax=Belonocnema kinseyi TaxID=2817044 RepID=UPI00143D06AD|nr:protein lethal(2)essential for life-like [Belonocnema kinseyi]
MSLVPLLFSDWWEDLDRPHQLLDQNFGLGLRPEQLLSPRRLEQLVSPRRCPMIYYRPWADLMREADGGASVVQSDKDKFQVQLDVQQFKPEEIEVKVADKYVVVSGKHEEKKDEHGWISRQFVRKYMIPEQCDVEQVKSSLSSDGVLSIEAPRKEQPELQNEKVIPIAQTGKPAVKANSEKAAIKGKEEVQEKKK